MKYGKSILAGIAAMILISYIIPILVVFGHIFPLALRGLRTGGFGISSGWHLQALSLQEWLLLFSSFGLGFFWELRRLDRRDFLRGAARSEPVL